MALAFIPQNCFAQFAEIPAGLTGMAVGEVAWGDYDNDGDLDILSTGSPTFGTQSTKIYRNDGNGTFVEINDGLPNVSYGSAAWGDYDNDGDLDILITGTDYLGTDISRIYRNNGNSSFTNINAGLQGVYYSSVAWGDYDNDGDLDVLLSGSYEVNSNTYRTTKIYRNDGNGVFVDTIAQLPAIYLSSIAWGDYDNDGDLDILLAGYKVPDRICRIYRNDGNNSFTDINAGLTGMIYASVAWGDYDNDGDLDIVIAGRQTGDGKISKIYRNDGNNSFVDLNAGLAGVGNGEVKWGDFDNDGDLDLLLVGWTGSTNIARIYRNDGSGVFVNINASLTGAIDSSAAWGDFDNDGDLDIVIIGSPTTATFSAKVYRNDTTAANSVPSVPTNLTFTISGEQLILQWAASSDAQTPSSGLSYILKIGITPGGSEFSSPMADSLGYRLIPQRGYIGATNRWKMQLSSFVPEQQYYWSIQAIDTALSGSAFSQQGTFSIPDFPKKPENLQVVMNGNDAHISWNAVNETIFGTPVVPDYYFVWVSTLSSADAPFNFLASVEGTSYIHSGASLSEQRLFYRVSAVKFH